MKTISTIFALVSSILVAEHLRSHPEFVQEYLGASSIQPAEQVPRSPPRLVPSERLGTRLDQAERASRESIEHQLEALRGFFDEAHAGTKPFAETALGLSSKARLVADAIPYTKGGRHKRFLRAEFEKHVFSEQDLKEALELLIKNYVDSLTQIDNQLLVQRRVDIEDFPGLQGNELPEISFEPLIAKTIAHMQQSIPGDITRETISMVVSGILTRIAARLGISAGILGTGTASSATTFGLSLVAAIVIDHLVCRLWDEFADPTGKLQAELNATLSDALSQLESSLRDELISLANQRAQIRSDTLKSILLQQGT